MSPSPRRDVHGRALRTLHVHTAHAISPFVQGPATATLPYRAVGQTPPVVARLVPELLGQVDRVSVTWVEAVDAACLPYYCRMPALDEVNYGSGTHSACDELVDVTAGFGEAHWVFR
ncbi:hypothetical protein FHL15_010329 [Xylaria flabelliformis]|uniref:Uncharacterized protein n=1 Tax=Xylaria flabelliformis TaxID=2512241 RepID=A0A553HLC1_9PEZI|nr:hypothetical protein FHL15_010329 [Xylaria flabelliformis]